MKKFVILVLISLLFLSCSKDSNQQKTLNPLLPEEHKPVVLLDETVNVSAGSYRTYTLTAKIGYTLHIDITSDTAVNVWVMREEEYSHFEKGESFNYISEASREKVLRFSCDLKSAYGDYYLVLDNKFSWITSKTVSVKVIGE
ncbi:MAG: hypothetical protein QG646_197 [Euryarchaeota archaeon]|nr:hypothetical protein [Euryarchaeota archaeon]